MEEPKFSSDVGSATIKQTELSGKKIEKHPRVIIVWTVIEELMIVILLLLGNARHISNYKRGKSFGTTNLKTF